MSKAKLFPPAGTATGGVCRPDPKLWTLPEMGLLVATEAEPGFALDFDDALRSRDEQRFFDWCIGILEDAGVVGVLRDDYIYQASTLHAQIYPESGTPYFLVLSRKSVEFYIEESKDAPLLFDPAVVETDEDLLEASELRSAFDMIRRQAALLRAWKDSTSLASNKNVVFKNFRISSDDSEFAVEVEMPTADFIIVVRRLPAQGNFAYSLAGTDNPFVHSPRVVDALLSDAAEEVGGVPDPATAIIAMIATAWLAQRDPEWQAANTARNVWRA
jgi:hypothetical protein